MNFRNGYRDRRWDTRAGAIELAIPRLRQGSYFPEWLLERRRRSEQALVSVVATSYLLGVSTRRVEKLAETLGIKSLSKSQVSELARRLDGAAGAVPVPAAGRRAVPVRAGRCADPAGPRGRPHGAGARADRHRRQCRRQAGDPRLRGHQRRGRRRLARVLPRPGRPRPGSEAGRITCGICSPRSARPASPGSPPWSGPCPASPARPKCMPSSTGSSPRSREAPRRGRAPVRGPG